MKTDLRCKKYTTHIFLAENFPNLTKLSWQLGSNSFFPYKALNNRTRYSGNPAIRKFINIKIWVFESFFNGEQ